MERQDFLSKQELAMKPKYRCYPFILEQSILNTRQSLKSLSERHLKRDKSRSLKCKDLVIHALLRFVKLFKEISKRSRKHTDNIKIENR